MRLKGGVIATEEWRRHGWMMPACVVGVMLVAIHNYTLGVMIRPLEQEFGWSEHEGAGRPMHKMSRELELEHLPLGVNR